MRMMLLVMIVALAGCGGGEAGSSAGPSTTGRGRDGVDDRPPLTFRPVAELTTGACVPELGADVMPSSAGTECFQFAGEGITVGAYGAKRSTSALPPTAAVDVTLTAADLERFNVLASQCFERSEACPAGQIAIIFDGRVHSAPTVQEPSFTGDISVSGEEREIEEMLRMMNQGTD